MNDIPKSCQRLRLASGLFLFLALSGLIPLLARYGVFSQWILLVHIIVGVAAVVPLSVIFLRHARAEAKVHTTRLWSPGLWSGLGWVVLCASGLWLVGKGIWGVFVPSEMHSFHWIAGMVLGAVAIFHIGYGLSKSEYVRARTAALARPVAWGIALTGVGALLILASRQKGSPAAANFNPSNARSATGQVIPADLLEGSASCGVSGCHSTIYKEWEPSAHRYSAIDLFYKAVKGNYIRDRGSDSPRYCAGCHEPIPLLSGQTFFSREQVGDKEGSSCAFCHSLRDVETRGNANYVVFPPHPYLFEQSKNPVLRGVAYMLIRLHPEQHDRDYNVKPSQTAEFCGACHKQYINKEENGWGFVQLQDQYDNWKNGPWHTDPRKNLQCQNCHMHEVHADDPARTPGGFIHDHRILASNNYMSEMLKLPGAKTQDDMVDAWLAGKTYIPEIAKVWPRGYILPVNLEPQGAFLPGRTATVRVLVTNLKVGHGFPTGPLDVIESWIEFQVTDARGNVIYRTGTIGSHGQIRGDTVEYRAHLMDKNDQAVYTHSLWNVVAAQGKRVIMPGGSDTAVFHFRIPAKTEGPLRCEARLLYRKFNSISQAQLFPVNPPVIPVVEISKASLELPLGGQGVKPKRAAITSTAPMKTSP